MSELVATWTSYCPTLRGSHAWYEQRTIGGAVILSANCPYCGATWVGPAAEVDFMAKYGKTETFFGESSKFIKRINW